MSHLRLRDAAGMVCSRDSGVLRFWIRELRFLLRTEWLRRRLRRELIGRDPIRTDIFQRRNVIRARLVVGVPTLLW